MEKIKVYDYLNLSKDRDILKVIFYEKIFYSESLLTIGHIGNKHERNFILTNKNAYIFKKKNLKAKIPLTSILGLSYSSISNEFIIHGKNEQNDTPYISENKILIICLIIRLFQELEDIVMPVCEINEKSLKNYITSESEKKKNKKYTKMCLSFQINTKSFINKYKHLVEKEEMSLINSENKDPTSLMMNYRNNKNIINRESKIKIEHFKLIKEIKRDSFGSIIIGTYIKDNKIYYLKSINKDFLIQNDLIEKKILEKTILQKMEFPFINKLIFCFQREENIFFGFNYIKAINLFKELCLCRSFNEERVKFYASIIGITLEFLHKNKIIYRNFNLKNISINEEGYLLFNIFYNARLNKNSDSYYSKYCSEEEYLSPEVIGGEGQSYISDWWSFGIIIYEMLYGFTPFLDDNDEKLFDMILNEEIKFPKKNNISAEAKDLIQKLLIKEKNERLGFDGGFDAIKTHYFFKGIDFDKLVKKQIEPPFKPIIEDEINIEEKSDFSFFDINNIDFEHKFIRESKLEFLLKNQDKFGQFYE